MLELFGICICIVLLLCILAIIELLILWKSRVAIKLLKNENGLIFNPIKASNILSKKENSLSIFAVIVYMIGQFFVKAEDADTIKNNIVYKDNRRIGKNFEKTRKKMKNSLKREFGEDLNEIDLEDLRDNSEFKQDYKNLWIIDSEEGEDNAKI